jgi:SAM-dependent methyltransferase
VSYRPDLYDVVTPTSFHGDVDWYREKAQAYGGPVLELGAGTGRVTLAIAEAGIPIHALDSSPEMLDTLAAKLAARPKHVRDRVTLVRADMRTFDLAEQFALVISPFRAFLHNVTDEDRLATLARVRHHLRPGGGLAFNVYHPSLLYMSRHAGPLEGVWRWVANVPLPAGGFIVRSEANRYDTVRQVVHSQHRYEEYDAGGVLIRTTLHRLTLAYLYPGDIQYLLARAGFIGVTVNGGFAGQPFSNDGDELVIEATSPRPA